MLDGVSVLVNINAIYTHKHKHHMSYYTTSCHMSPALDGAAAVGMEVTAAEGARDDTGVAADNVQF
jgi:hypothetical protein